jgi:hypothetical protein
MSNLTVAVYFTKTTGVPAEGLTLADIDLYLTAQNVSTGADTVIWDGTQNPTEEIDNVGAYIRIYGSADLDTYNYHGRGTYTGATVLDVDHVTGTYPCVNPWDFPTRTLTQTASTVATALEGGVISITRGDSLSVSITGLGDISGRTKLWFTVKTNRANTDAQSIIQIEESAGLLYINGAVATVAGNGSITVTDAVAGNITVALDEAETDDLEPTGRLYYDVQVLTAAGNVTTLSSDLCRVIADVTRVVV